MVMGLSGNTAKATAGVGGFRVNRDVFVRINAGRPRVSL